MRYWVSILYLGLHASCSILRIFSSLHSWKEVEGGVLWKKGIMGGVFYFHQKFQKNNFSQKVMGDTTRFIFET
jgi:hypothetical protein